jgi:hypothetical protein
MAMAETFMPFNSTTNVSTGIGLYSQSVAPLDNRSYAWMQFGTEILTKWFQIFTMIIGIPGNIMSLLVTLKKGNRQIGTCIYMAALAIVDSFVLIIVMTYKVLVFHGLGKGLEANHVFLR